MTVQRNIDTWKIHLWYNGHKKKRDFPQKSHLGRRNGFRSGGGANLPERDATELKLDKPYYKIKMKPIKWWIGQHLDQDCLAMHNVHPLLNL